MCLTRSKQADGQSVLWERDQRLSSSLTSHSVTSPHLDFQWMEDRFWVWVHKACGKVGRGELLEAIEYLTFLRSKVLGPLGLSAAGQPPTGVRRIEIVAPSLANDLNVTLASSNALDCFRALRACVNLYCRIRANEGAALQYRHGAERAVTDYLNELEKRITTDTIESSLDALPRN